MKFLCSVQFVVVFLLLNFFFATHCVSRISNLPHGQSTNCTWHVQSFTHIKWLAVACGCDMCESVRLVTNNFGAYIRNLVVIPHY